MTQVARSVGRYELLEEIGRGGMAVVYRARQTDLRRLVAVKELGALHTPDRSLAQRFVFEARLAGSLTHPNVVTVFDFFEHAGIPYIAMEYLPRGSLRGCLRDLTLAQAAGVFEGLLAGLAHAEKDGVVHRDLKPENLMLSRDGRIKIADFGIAKASGDVQTGAFHTATGTTIGTPDYMAPEQAMGKPLGTWTDLYAVGVIAFELFTGDVPFPQTDTPMAVMFRHIEEPIPSVSTLNPTVPHDVSGWIERLLIKDPELRTRSATTAWDELEEIIIDLLGPRWRRNSQLPEAGRRQPDPTEARNQSPYETFRLQDPIDPVVGGPATPPPVDLPAGPMMPSTPDIPVGPSTPASLHAAADDRSTHAGDATAKVDNEEATLAPAPPTAREASSPLAAPEPHITPEPKLPERRRPHSTPEPHAPRPRRRAVIAGTGVLALIAAAAVMALPGDEPTRPSVRVALVAGPVAVGLPAGWRPTAAPPATAGLALASSAAGAPGSDSARGSVTIGLGPPSASNATLLRPAFVENLAASAVAARQNAGKLPGGLQAYLYDGLRPPRGAASLTVYTAPTSAGVATIACAAPALPAVCEQIARTLTVKGATAFPLGPNAGYANRVNKRLRLLATALDRAHANIRAASTAKRQANAASAIAAAYRHSRRPLTSLTLSPADVSANAALLAALKRASDAYTALARAARHERGRAYRQAAGRARDAQSAIMAAVAELTSHGYRRLITERFHEHAIARLKRPPPAASSSASVTGDTSQARLTTPSSDATSRPRRRPAKREPQFR